MRRTFATPALCALPLLACALTPPVDVPATVQQAARQQIQAKNAGGISVAIVDGGKIIASQTFGDANSDTSFSVGSVSKMFTAVSIMQLAGEGKIGIDASAATYLPAHPQLGNITVRELLDHTSGLPNYLDDALAAGEASQKTTPAQIVAAALSKPLDFKPGSDWNYSNTGYVVLGQIVEHVSGVSLAQFEQENIFKPLGMHDTFVAPALGTQAAKPYQGEPGDWSWYYACGDVFSTALDLARFDIALMNGQLLGRNAFLEMQQGAPYPTFAPGISDGLGVFVTQLGKVREVGHHGGEPGFRADNQLVPANGFAVVVVGSGNYNTAPLVNAALSAYFPAAALRPAQSSSAYVDGAPPITARMSALLKNLAAGKADTSQMEIMASIQVPVIMNQMKTNGSFSGLRFLSKAYTSSGILYEYQALFAKQNAILVVQINRDGKMSALQMIPIPKRT